MKKRPPFFCFFFFFFFFFFINIHEYAGERGGGGGKSGIMLVLYITNIKKGKSIRIIFEWKTQKQEKSSRASGMAGHEITYDSYSSVTRQVYFASVRELSSHILSDVQWSYRPLQAPTAGNSACSGGFFFFLSSRISEVCGQL